MEFRARRWRRLLNLIDGIPQNSHFHAAMIADEELARLTLDAPDGDEEQPDGLPMHVFSPEVEALAAVYDRLGNLTSLLHSVHSRKGTTPLRLARYPRPVSASQRLRSERRVVKHRSLVARVIKKKN